MALDWAVAEFVRTRNPHEFRYEPNTTTHERCSKSFALCFYAETVGRFDFGEEWTGHSDVRQNFRRVVRADF